MSRRATIRTDHDDPALLARAIRPDNTDEMSTSVDRAAGGTDSGDDTPVGESGEGTGGTLVTRIDRETTSGLRSTVDDYVVNLSVAIDVATHTQIVQHAQPTDTGSVSDTPSDSDTR
ncbi:KEOPS complex subunit Pcc1 [Natrinema gelatinilyticum]|uniref:KEOPS complex subunit Pcc1 n=1 Tax=Natrinema gelatinilyticum TaxID=2961571 RepID=UPI0020C2DF3B|nr:KEOPS complex subunit Pcc1 [Natrinema gelatinilyticum]